jgi:hypothetical protein
MTTEFQEFPKMARLSRECIITEKIDGTNASVYIGEDGEFLTGSRTRWVTPEDDNYGFAKWCALHRDELLTLGPGHHFGEWWGQGIQRKYGLAEKRWSLFNVSRWALHGAEPQVWKLQREAGPIMQDVLPPCCSLVPVLARDEFSTLLANTALERLKVLGSEAAPGFKNPEGIVIWHVAAQVGFKKTIEKDEVPKSMVRQ